MVRFASCAQWALSPANKEHRSIAAGKQVLLLRDPQEEVKKYSVACGEQLANKPLSLVSKEGHALRSLLCPLWERQTKVLRVVIRWFPGLTGANKQVPSCQG